MSYELAYFPTFIDNLRIWYAEKYSSDEKLKAAFDRKIDRITRYLEKEFKPIYEKYAKMDYTPSGEIPKVIWIMWWQGESTSIPPIVKACINSVRKNAEEYEIRIITKENIQSYIDISDIITYHASGAKAPRLTLQFMSDIIRSRLLYKHGGIWLDATMFVASNKFLQDLSSSSFFTLKLLQSDEIKLFTSPSKGLFSDSCWATTAENPFFSFINECMTYHLTHHKKIWDYFLIDYSINIGMEFISFIHNQSANVPYTNPKQFWLANHLNEKFNHNLWNEITESTNIFKLNWRYKEQEDKQLYTFFDFVMNNKAKD